ELRKAIRSNKNNLIVPISKARLKDWIDTDPSAAIEALRAAADVKAPLGERARSFLARLPEEVTSGLHSRARLAGFAVFVSDPEEAAPYQLTHYQQAYELTSAAPDAESTDPAVVYEQAMAFLDAFIEEAAA